MRLIQALQALVLVLTAAGAFTVQLGNRSSGCPGQTPLGPGSLPEAPNATASPADTLLRAAYAGCAKYDVFAHFDAAAAEAAVGAGEAPPIRMSLPAVSILIGAFQRYATLEMIVKSLRMQVGVRVEIIIADAGSQPPVLQAVPGLAAAVDKVIYQADDGLYHRVRSFRLAAAAASNEVLVLLDDDVVPASRHWAAAAFRTVSPPSSSGIARMPLVIKEFKGDLSDAASRVEEVSHFSWGPDAISGFSTCNLAIRRGVWDRLGGFDMRYDGVYGEEDHDFNRRVREAQVQVGMAPPYGCALHVGLFFGNRGLGKPSKG
jgi:hypothetical protein